MQKKELELIINTYEEITNHWQWWPRVQRAEMTKLPIHCCSIALNSSLHDNMLVFQKAWQYEWQFQLCSLTQMSWKGHSTMKTQVSTESWKKNKRITNRLSSEHLLMAYVTLLILRSSSPSKTPGEVFEIRWKCMMGEEWNPVGCLCLTARKPPFSWKTPAPLIQMMTVLFLLVVHWKWSISQIDRGILDLSDVPHTHPWWPRSRGTVYILKLSPHSAWRRLISVYMKQCAAMYGPQLIHSLTGLSLRGFYDSPRL